MKQEKLLKLADFVDNPELATANALIDIQDVLISTIPQESRQNTEQILALIQELNSVIPESKDYSDDLQEIKDKLNEEDEIEVTLHING